MGRAGGGGGFSGGGHSGGGFSGGSHHTGGFSGGGSFGGGRAGGGFGGPMGGGGGRAGGGPRPGGAGGPGGFGGPRPGGPRPGGPRHGGPRPGGPMGPGFGGPGPRPPHPHHPGPGPRRGNCATTIFALLLLLLVCSLIAFSGDNSFDTGYSDSYSSSVTESTIEREKLNASDLVLTSYYYDEAGYIRNGATLEKGMKDFYQQTGVQPVIYITDNIDGNTNPTEEEVAAKCESLYSELFTDEAHFFILFVDSTELEDAGTDFLAQYEVGNEARTVMDDEAIEIVEDYIKACYYDSSYSDWDDFLSAAYEKSGERIMYVPTSPWPIVFGIAGVGVIVIVGYTWWGKKRQADKEKAEETEKILNTPLESFGSAKVDDAASDLAKKYEDTDKSQETTDV